MVATRRVDFHLRRRGFWGRAARVIAISAAVADVLCEDGVTAPSGWSWCTPASTSRRRGRRTPGHPRAARPPDGDHASPARSARWCPTRITSRCSTRPAAWRADSPPSTGSSPARESCGRCSSGSPASSKSHRPGALSGTGRPSAPGDRRRRHLRHEQPGGGPGDLGARCHGAWHPGCIHLRRRPPRDAAPRGRDAGSASKSGGAGRGGASGFCATPELRRGVVERASRAVERFSAERMAAEVRSVYRSCAPLLDGS